MTRNILFICKYNVFRSKVAEAYFKKINKNKNIKVKSAGIISGCIRGKNTTASVKEFGLSLKGNSKGLNINLLKWADIIIIVADDVPREIFKYNNAYPRRVILWKLKDVFGAQKNADLKRRMVIEEITKKVDELNKEMLKWKLQK